MQPDLTVSVIYLCYIPYGQKCLVDFICSYEQFKAGCDHELVIVFKGMKNKQELDPFLKLLEKKDIRFRPLHYMGDGFDLNAYLWAASQVDDEYLYFLNSSSVLNAENWLYNYKRHMIGTMTMISATGSWQSYYSAVFLKNTLSWESAKSFNENFRKYKLLLKAALYWRFLFPAFPNPHLRTNAFMIKRHDFLFLKNGSIDTRFKSYLFESGKNSMTNQLLKKGGEVAVVDKQGKLYPFADWKLSNTFWNAKQENLLVSDNQTRIYDEASETEKIAMTKLAWGNG